MSETPEDPTSIPDPHDKGPAAGKAVAGRARADRLKAALKVNMARRKAQAKARAAGETGSDGNKKD